MWSLKLWVQDSVARTSQSLSLRHCSFQYANCMQIFSRLFFSFINFSLLVSFLFIYSLFISSFTPLLVAFTFLLLFLTFGEIVSSSLISSSSLSYAAVESFVDSFLFASLFSTTSMFLAGVSISYSPCTHACNITSTSMPGKFV